MRFEKHLRISVNAADSCVTVSLPLLPVRVQVEFYVNENTFKERLKLFFIKNQRSSKWMVPATISCSYDECCLIERAH